MTTYVELLATVPPILEAYAPYKAHGEGGWMITCPLHGGMSLHLTVTDRLLFYCHGGCGDSEALMSRLKVDGVPLDLKCSDYAASKKGGAKGHLSQNIPAHDQVPIDWRVLNIEDDEGVLRPVTRCYPYTDKLGQVLFYVLRADTNILNKKGKKIKSIKCYSSVHNSQTNTDTWEFQLKLYPNPRPLYNLQDLAAFPDKPVLVVEGEKTCEAAKILFPDYVCTTYILGMGNWKNADWKPLQGRDVTLWPDNEEKAIEQFLGIAGAIQPTPKIVFTAPLLDGRPEGWDVADEIPEGCLDNNTLLKNSFIPEVKKTTTIAEEGEIFAKWNGRLRLLWVGGEQWVYDKLIRNPDPGARIPYFHTAPRNLSLHHPQKIQVSKNREEYEVDHWLDNENKIKSYGLVFDPTTEEELVYADGHLVTNKFMGWAHKPKACDPKLYEAFPNHIYNIMDKTAADYLMAMLAQMVQDPKTKPGVMPILIGKTLHGKTIIGAILSAMLGDRNILITDGKTFNEARTGVFAGKLGVFVNEFTRKHQNDDWLNAILTDKVVSFDQKYERNWNEPSYHRIIATTNAGDFLLSSDDRRLYPIKVVNPSIDSHNKHNPKNEEYYKPLKTLIGSPEGLSGLHQYLKDYKIEINIFTPPVSDFRLSKMSPIDPLERIILDICETGSLPEAFGKRLVDYLGTGTTNYPQYVLKSFMFTMAVERYKYTGTRNNFTRSMNRFIECNRDAIVQSYHYLGNQTIESGRDRPFEIPPLEELRKRYNEHVDPLQVWPEVTEVWPEVTEAAPDKKPLHLHLVKDEDGPL